MLISLSDFILIACLVATSVLALRDYFRLRSRHRPLAFGLVLVAVAIGVFFMVSPASSKQAFGPASASPLVALALMFVGVLLGIAATYVFNLTGPFSWRDLARPLVVSPLVLLPLIGSLQGSNLEPVQLICFVVLAFQNGFFWQQVLRDAKPTTS
jgi:hypothetical protein